MASKTASNKNRVPVKQWKRWSNAARAVFNAVYSRMKADAELFLHPRQKAPTPTHWKTTAWNAAWIAADAVDGRETAVEG